jgi:hypothetical protein
MAMSRTTPVTINLVLASVRGSNNDTHVRTKSVGKQRDYKLAHSLRPHKHASTNRDHLGWQMKVIRRHGMDVAHQLT